jgi:hypothetical protein
MAYKAPCELAPAYLSGIISTIVSQVFYILDLDCLHICLPVPLTYTILSARSTLLLFTPQFFFSL